MKIEAIKTNYCNYTRKSPTFGINIKPSVMVDALELSTKTTFEKALSKINKITKQEYDSLTPSEINVLRQKAKEFGFDEELSDHQFAAESIKQNFDKIYGESNYNIIMIGRSLASIGKLLGMKIGEERVKYVPMSSLSDMVQAYPLTYKAWKNFLINWQERCNKGDLQTFLAKQDLTKEKIENSDKQYIVMDFTASGKSLNTAYGLLTLNDYLGNKNNNIKRCSIVDVLPEFLYLGKRFKLMMSLMSSRFKQFSHVDNLYKINKNNLEKSMNPKTFYTSSSENKQQEFEKYQLFGFTMLDSEYGDATKPNPYNDLLAICHDNPFFEQDKLPWENALSRYNDDLVSDSFLLYSKIDAAQKSGNRKRVKKLLSFAENMRVFYGDDFILSFEQGLVAARYYRVFRPKLMRLLAKD